MRFKEQHCVLTFLSFLCQGVLYVLNAEAIDPAAILVRRKRLGTPATTPAALTRLRALAGLPAAAEQLPAPEELAETANHLREMSGASAALAPLLFTAGLPALASLWCALAAGAIPKSVGAKEEDEEGGAEVLMASTAYGGSSQLTDLLAALSANRFRRHSYDVQGAARVEESVAHCLARLEGAGPLLPRTVLFLENPTNPDMK